MSDQVGEGGREEGTDASPSLTHSLTLTVSRGSSEMSGGAKETGTAVRVELHGERGGDDEGWERDR